MRAGAVSQVQSCGTSPENTATLHPWEGWVTLSILLKFGKCSSACSHTTQQQNAGRCPSLSQENPDSGAPAGPDNGSLNSGGRVLGGWAQHQVGSRLGCGL